MNIPTEHVIVVPSPAAVAKKFSENTSTISRFRGNSQPASFKAHGAGWKNFLSMKVRARD
jgi:hypothetical protein